MNYEQALSIIRKHRLIAILRGIPVEDSIRVAHALYEGGVRAMEFTYDHHLADCVERNSEQVRRVCREFGDSVLIGCGTVLSEEEVRVGYEAGARLIISPNTDAAVIRAAREAGMVSMPGAMTPTEVVEAHRCGADIVKLFPSAALGLEYIKALRAPLKHIPMSAVGGVQPETISDYLNAGILCFGIGSGLVSARDIANDDMAAITGRSRQYVSAIEEWEAAQK